MEYTVCIGVDGYVNLIVDAANEEKAKEKALLQVEEMDFGNLDDVEQRVVTVEP